MPTHQLCSISRAFHGCVQGLVPGEILTSKNVCKPGVIGVYLGDHTKKTEDSSLPLGLGQGWEPHVIVQLTDDSEGEFSGQLLLDGHSCPSLEFAWQRTERKIGAAALASIMEELDVRGGTMRTYPSDHPASMTFREIMVGSK